MSRKTDPNRYVDPDVATLCKTLGHLKDGGAHPVRKRKISGQMQAHWECERCTTRRTVIVSKFNPAILLIDDWDYPTGYKEGVKLPWHRWNELSRIQQAAIERGALA